MSGEHTTRTDGVVTLRRPSARDAQDVLAAARASEGHLRPWVSPPVDACAFERMLARAGSTYVPSVLERVEDGALLGVFTLSEIVRGCFLSAYLGYYAFAPHAGRGLMARGLRLLLRFAFEDLGLHRLEANVQPDNARSIAFVRAAGFVREGYSRGYLFIDGAWRDHERWALLREAWSP
jgi:ribosomal-protein-alanine N-acetyltransferase